jgi:hypothetical protein
MKKKIEVPTWVKPLWRAFRTAFVVALVQTMSLQLDWNEPQNALYIALSSLASGTLVALGKYIRDEYSVKYPVLTKLPF